MKKEIIIGGVVVAVGAVAYFLYTKQKKKEEGLVIGSQLASPTTEPITTVNPQTPPTPTGGVVSPSTTLMSIEEQNKLDQARDIFEKIKQNRLFSDSANKVIDKLKTPMFGSSSTPSSLISLKDASAFSYVKLKDDLLKLGYEVKGTTNLVLVKLNSL